MTMTKGIKMQTQRTESDTIKTAITNRDAQKKRERFNRNFNFVIRLIGALAMIWALSDVLGSWELAAFMVGLGTYAAGLK